MPGRSIARGGYARGKHHVLEAREGLHIGTGVEPHSDPRGLHAGTKVPKRVLKLLFPRNPARHLELAADVPLRLEQHHLVAALSGDTSR